MKKVILFVLLSSAALIAFAGCTPKAPVATPAPTPVITEPASDVVPDVTDEIVPEVSPEGTINPDLVSPSPANASPNAENGVNASVSPVATETAKP